LNERWMRKQAMDQGAIKWAMNVTSGEIEGEIIDQRWIRE
jgi:hypothetical protein